MEIDAAPPARAAMKSRLLIRSPRRLRRIDGRWKNDAIMSALGGPAKLHRSRARHLAGAEASSASPLAKEDRQFEQTSGYAKGPVMAQSCPLMRASRISERANFLRPFLMSRRLRKVSTTAREPISAGWGAIRYLKRIHHDRRSPA